MLKFLVPVCVSLAVACCVATAAPQGAVPADWAERIRAGWVGKLSAGSGALPTEMWHRDQIRRKYGELTSPPQTPTPRGPLDDTTLALLGWQAAQKHGPAFTSADIAAEWVEHLPDAELKGGGFGREFLDVLKRLRQGETPPVKTGTPRGEWIAAQMRAEIWGMLAPGDAARAADYAQRDARIFNAGNAVYASQFVAAIASRLMVDSDILSAINTARESVPEGSALASVIDDALTWYSEDATDWGAAWDRFVDAYRDRGMEQQFATWSDEWLVETGGWPEAEVLNEYLGQRSVLRTHPFGETEPARLSTEVAVPAEGGQLVLRVNCNVRPADVDWLMRVQLGGTVREEAIHWIDGQPRWQDFTYDLDPWAGQTLTIVLENGVLNKFGWEAGFWARPRLLDDAGGPLQGRPPTGRPHRYPLCFQPMILPETFSVLAGLLYGEGDFRRSVSIATMCGFDTDCNAGTVGCLLGLRNGLDSIPAEWRDSIGDAYEVQVAGLPREWSIAELAREIAATGRALAEAPAGEDPPVEAEQAPGQAQAPRPGRSGKFTLMALGDNGLADLDAVPQRYDLMIASHSVGRDVIESFRRRNPDALVFCYFNTSDVNRDWIRDPYYARVWQDTNPHENWFHHDEQGERVRIYYPKYKNRCALNTGVPDLQRFLAGRVVETLATGLYDGIQLDNVSTEFPFKASLVGKWISGTPVDLTPAQYTADEVSMLKTIMDAVAQAGFGEKTIIFNHMRSGEPQESRAYVEVTNGANCESWLSQRTDFEGRWGWQAKVEQVREVNRLGKLTNLLCVPSRLSEDEARFCFASYLMAVEGDRSYFFYGPDYRIAGPQNAWYPFYDVDLGAPQGDSEPTGGAYWRPFSEGAVVVNPTAAPVTFELPQRYVTLAGAELTTLTLGPKQAELLQLPGR